MFYYLQKNLMFCYLKSEIMIDFPPNLQNKKKVEYIYYRLLSLKSV